MKRKRCKVYDIHIVTTGSVNKRRKRRNEKDVDDPFREKVKFQKILRDEIVNNKKPEKVFKFPSSGREVSCYGGKKLLLSHTVFLADQKREGMNKFVEKEKFFRNKFSTLHTHNL